MQHELENIMKPPSWITKYGISTLFAVLVVLVTLIIQIPFSDVVSGTAKIKPFSSSIKIKISDRHKIEIGQNVFINIKNYSDNTNMKLTGKVEKLLKVESKVRSLYFDVSIHIDSLDYKKAVEQGLPDSILGEGHILIGESSLFQRVIHSF